MSQVGSIDSRITSMIPVVVPIEARTGESVDNLTTTCE